MRPAVIGEEIGQLKVLGTDPGKTLVKHDDIDRFLRCNTTCQGLGNAAHTFPLAFLTDPKWPVHNIILNHRELGQAIRFGGVQRDRRRLT